MNTVFISSTFKDMQFERDILQNNVLPRIKDFAKQYGRNMELCDPVSYTHLTLPTT